jgi:hypothetical protein
MWKESSRRLDTCNELDKAETSSVFASTTHSLQKTPKADVSYDIQPYEEDYSRENGQFYDRMWCLWLYDSVGMIVKVSATIKNAYERVGLCKDISNMLENAPARSIMLI